MKRILLSIAKTWLGGLALHWTLAYFTFLIPGEKLAETRQLLAFHHPAPSYPLHILIVPRAGLRSLSDLPSPDLAFERELFKVVKQLIAEFGLENYSYRLIANGGQAQEVDQLHFHLVSDDYRQE